MPTIPAGDTPGYGRQPIVMMVMPGQFLIAWDEPGDAVVLRSQFQGDGYEVIAQLTGQGQYVDTPPGRPTDFTRWYYKVLIGDRQLGPETMTDVPDAESVHIAWLARRHIERIGEDAYLFSARTKGERCGECWDEVLRTRTRSKCDACGGTGFIDAIASPIPLKMSFGKEEPTPQRLQTGKITQLQVAAWTGNVPLLKKGDVVVRKYDRRVFDVVQWQPTRKRSFVLRQNIICKMAERGSAAYDYATRV